MEEGESDEGRRPRGGRDQDDLVGLQALAGPEGVQQGQLGGDEEVDLSGRERGVQEMAGGAGVPSLQAGVLMEEIDKEREEEKGEEEADIEADPVFLEHAVPANLDYFNRTGTQNLLNNS